MSVPAVLLIAGSDSSGGAGLEADQRTLAAHGVYATTATTALTAQNTFGVEDIHITPPAFVEKQIRCVLNDTKVQVVKMGMLASAETVSAVAKTLDEYRERCENDLKIVLDPVMVSTSGHQLLPEDAVRNLRERLLPSTFILTPNIPEATLLLRDAGVHHNSPSSLNDLKSLAQKIHSLGSQHVLLKGGHMPLNKRTKQKASPSDPDEDKIIVDILCSQSPPTTNGSSSSPQIEIIEQPYLSSPNTHGTGCTLASAIAALLSIHVLTSPDAITPLELPNLIRSATSYVSSAISSSTTLSLTLPSPLHNSTKSKSGPLNHFHSHQPPLYPTTTTTTAISSSSSSSSRSLTTYLLTHPRLTPSWQKYTHHPFPTLLATASLPSAKFTQYLIQDYHFLTSFARAHSLAGSKLPLSPTSTTSSSVSRTAAAARLVLAISEETNLHLEFCKCVGVTEDMIRRSPEATATTAYSRWILDIASSRDQLSMYVALLPCLLGYQVIAKRILLDEHNRHETQKSRDGKTGQNPKDEKGIVEIKASPYKTREQGNEMWKWIETYTSSEYGQAVEEGVEIVESLASEEGVRWAKGRVEGLVEVWERAVELEVGFFDAAMKGFDDGNDTGGDVSGDVGR